MHMYRLECIHVNVHVCMYVCISYFNSKAALLRGNFNSVFHAASSHNGTIGRNSLFMFSIMIIIILLFPLSWLATTVPSCYVTIRRLVHNIRVSFNGNDIHTYMDTYIHTYMDTYMNAWVGSSIFISAILWVTSSTLSGTLSKLLPAKAANLCHNDFLSSETSPAPGHT